jgi:hypothetical protein
MASADYLPEALEKTESEGGHRIHFNRGSATGWEIVRINSAQQEVLP